jgi:hypothetical protein
VEKWLYFRIDCVIGDIPRARFYILCKRWLGSSYAECKFKFLDAQYRCLKMEASCNNYHYIISKFS